MKKKFAVLVDTASDKQDDEFLKWLKEKGAGWWHWLSNSWLIANRRGRPYSQRNQRQSQRHLRL
jgi:hypothetical protein